MSNRGFTILETIVALGVISLAIAGVFSAVRTGLVASINSKDEIRAFYLVQEAIEVLRQKRDNNKLTSINSGIAVNWLTGIANVASDPCFPGKTCMVNGYTNTISVCSEGWNSCPVLRQNASSYLYGYDGAWTATKYKREIQIEKNGANEVVITISVRWSKGVNNYEFKVKTLLLNWR